MLLYSCDKKGKWPEAGASMKAQVGLKKHPTQFSSAFALDVAGRLKPRPFGVATSCKPWCRFRIWVWLKIKQEGLRRFWSMVPLTRVPFWCRFFEPRPYLRSKDQQISLIPFREGQAISGWVSFLFTSTKQEVKVYGVVFTCSTRSPSSALLSFLGGFPY